MFGITIQIELKDKTSSNSISIKPHQRRGGNLPRNISIAYYPGTKSQGVNLSLLVVKRSMQKTCCAKLRLAKSKLPTSLSSDPLKLATN